MTSVRAFRVFDEGGTIQGRIVETSLDGMSQGDVVLKTAYSSVNYKDALAATGAGKIIRRFPLTAGIDVSGTVVSSADPRFREGDAVVVTGFDFGVAHDGGFAEMARVPADWLVKLPVGLSLFDAMAIGTAGFTAALSIVEMEHNGLAPESGPVVVTGATGGVGCLAVDLLASRGYAVTAVTGKAGEHDFLRSLGAREVLARDAVPLGTRPLEKAQWAGAVDPVGGAMLGWLTRTMTYGGTIANSGLTGGTELHTTVMPFILRGIKLLGIDSAACAMPRRLDVWRRLATDMKPRHLHAIAREVGLSDLPAVFADLLAGRARGRTVVKMTSLNLVIWSLGHLVID